MSEYTQHGYESRQDYLDHLAKDMDIERELVFMAADMLGPNEDFDGLVTELEDYWEENL